MNSLVLSLNAEKQLENIFLYVEAKFSERIRRELAKKIYHCFKLIENNPELFSFSDYNRSLRECVVAKQTTVFYQIRKDNIVVVSVFDTRQNPKKIKNTK
jgi:plasmid stabilization system protein ParE